MGFLGGYLWLGIGAAFLALTVALGVQTKRVEWAKEETTKVENAWAAAREAATAAVLKAETEARTEEQRRVAVQKEISDAYEKNMADARADAAAASTASDKLQQRVATLIAASRQTSCNPTVIDKRTPAESITRVLADVQRRTDEAAGRMAAVADDRGAAGAACVSAYDSLSLSTRTTAQP